MTNTSKSGRIGLEVTAMTEPTLVVLAAGLSSRYGSLKQIDPIGRHGEIIIDYSVFDAVRAGFKRVVFLIAPWMYDEFEEAIARRVSRHVEIAYAFQTNEKFLPEGFEIPPGRKKPWGTAHALLCCREVLDGPFAMINADDYYGPQAFRDIYSALSSVDCSARPMRFCMAGYRLGNTLTDSGKVSRGICVSERGMLRSIVERTYVVRTPDGPAYSTDGGKTLVPVPADSVVSMNFWGFTPDILCEIERRFPVFLREKLPLNAQDEMYVPNLVGELLREGLCSVRVLESGDVWHGMTYREDKPDVVRAISELTDSGLYPEKLW